jgi:hypothetical protein
MNIFHLKDDCKSIKGLIPHGLSYIIMMWCIKIGQIIKTHIKYKLAQNKTHKKWVQTTMKEKKICACLDIKIHDKKCFIKIS